VDGFGMSGINTGGLSMGGFDVDPRFQGNDLAAIERRLGPDAGALRRARNRPGAAGATGVTGAAGAAGAAGAEAVGTKAPGAAGADGTQARGPIDRHSRLYRACEDFEALFIKQMLSSMRKTVHKTGLMDGGMAEEIFEDMLYDEYALKMARSAGFGLSDTLYRELSRNPSVRSRSL